MQLAYPIILVLCYETIWLHPIHALIKIAIKEYSLDIQSSYLIIKMCCNG